MAERRAILVAGGAGYIGAHICKHLHTAGYTPVTLDNLSTGYEAAVQWGPLHVGETGNADLVAALVRKYDIAAAMHFAAFSQVGESMLDPGKYYRNNVADSTVYVEALIAAGVEALVFSSTAAVYGLPETMPISESAATQPINPYGASKRAFEDLLGWLARAGRLRSTVLRYFNAAGSDATGAIGESHVPETHLIPLVCQAALGLSGPITVFGEDYPTEDGTAVRDYIHVSDLADAHILALEWLLGGAESRTWNVGTSQGASVTAVLGAAQRVLGRPVPMKMGPRRPGDPPVLVADAQAIGRDLGWRPTHSLHDMIESAARWQTSKSY